MTNKGKYYLPTAIAYTSGKPHIGNVYEIVLADAIARFKRKEGYDVFFQTGTDEHGEKNELKAAAGTLGDAFRADACLNLLRLMPNHNANVLCATAFCGFNHIIHHALIQNFMEYLRFLGFHTGAFAGSQNDCFQLSHLFFLLRQRAKYFSRYCIHTF